MQKNRLPGYAAVAAAAVAAVVAAAVAAAVVAAAAAVLVLKFTKNLVALSLILCIAAYLEDNQVGFRIYWSNKCSDIVGI